MVVIKCDSCGREIKSDGRYAELDVTYKRSDIPRAHDDLCEECLNRVARFILNGCRGID